MSRKQSNTFPLIADLEGDYKELIHIEMPPVLPILPVRNIVMFPGVVMPILVGREQSLRLLQKVEQGNLPFAIFCQYSTDKEEPTHKDLYPTGVMAKLVKIISLPNNKVTAIVQGVRRITLGDELPGAEFMLSQVFPADELVPAQNDMEFNTAMGTLRDSITEFVEMNDEIPDEASFSVRNISNNIMALNYVCSNFVEKVTDRIALLSADDIKERLFMMIRYMNQQHELLSLKLDIRKKTHEEIDEQQRNYFLRQQIKNIQAEMGNEAAPEKKDLLEKAARKKWSDETKKMFLREVDKLDQLSAQSPDYNVQLTYLQTLVALPWDKCTKDDLNLKRAKRILDRDHYGMEKVKERIMEFLAVKSLAPDLKGQVLCLVGPPGVGKTSIAKSIAEAMGRNYTRMSLGGVRDEADIRGHRKTYIGAMPGRIMDALRRAGTSNPLILLDEIDKMGNDFRGDPASAMLEVLDTEQNVAFRDHYIELSFDLSDVVFLTTANDLSTVPRPLLDRMEVIELPSYTAEEKRLIARRHLLSKQMKKHGLSENQLIVDDETLDAIISGYTREAGVRRLEQVLAKLCRKAAKHIADGDESLTATKENLEELLGTATFKDDLVSKKDEVGIVNGLAWTSVGGEMLEVEVAVIPGTGKIEITGNLGTVMQESAKAAVTFVRSKAEALNIDPMFYKNNDLHIHFPEAAIPKDGPSAGVTITTALISALTGAPVRHEVAMTGEVTLRGRVLPIGGLREKTMAAYRAGIKTVCIPKDNESDLKDIVPVVRENINFVIAEHMDTVMETAIDFSRRPKQKKRKSAPVKRAADTASTTVVQ